MATGEYLCSACLASFPSQSLRREHMRHPWHVYNLKRRVVELPRISLDEYEALHASTTSTAPVQTAASRTPSPTQPLTPTSSSTATIIPSSSAALSSPDSAPTWQTTTPTTCLFCSSAFSSLTLTLSHMRTCHSFSVPNPSGVTTDIETLLTYTRAVIEQFHSCLYCGKEMVSAEAARAHMRSKGHERIDWESEEWSEFLVADGNERRGPEEGDEDAVECEGDNEEEGLRAKLVQGSEMVLPSGARVLSRSGAASQARTSRGSRTSRISPAARMQPQLQPSSASRQASPTSSDIQLTSASPPTGAPQRPTRALAKRDHQGLVGLPTQQLRALAVTEHKALKRENRARMQAQWVLEKIANRQKYFKPDVPGRSNG